MLTGNESALSKLDPIGIPNNEVGSLHTRNRYVCASSLLHCYTYKYSYHGGVKFILGPFSNCVPELLFKFLCMILTVIENNEALMASYTSAFQIKTRESEKILKLDRSNLGYFFYFSIIFSILKCFNFLTFSNFLSCFSEYIIIIRLKLSWLSDYSIPNVGPTLEPVVQLGARLLSRTNLGFLSLEFSHFLHTALMHLWPPNFVCR